MPENISFSGNYEDLSTDNGFQFEFKCDKCQSGFRSRFQAFAAGTVNTVLQSAGNLLGGIFSSASQVSDDVKTATWQKAHDEAFEVASKEILTLFRQCPRCSAWVCKEKCWNEKKGLCKTCAPDLGVEMAVVQSSKSVEEVWAHAAMAEEDKKLGTETWRKGTRANCPSCGKPISGVAVKFCPECGAEILAEKKCVKCGVKLPAGAKFCTECGTKAE